MRSIYNFIGAVFSVVGFIAGIILGVNTKNFAFCLYEWIGIFLFVMIYFGIAAILQNQEIIINKLKETPEQNSAKFVERKASGNEWKCPKCGAINQGYVGTCGCGELKPQ